MQETIRKQLDLPPIDQIGFVVRDLQQAITHYEPLFGPFTTMEPGPMSWTYRGREDEISEIKVAFCKSGALEIELIEWVSGNTPHKEFLDSGREGMHHLRFTVDNLEQRVAAAELCGWHSIWQHRIGPELGAAYLEHADEALLIEIVDKALLIEFFENQSLES